MIMTVLTSVTSNVLRFVVLGFIAGALAGCDGTLTNPQVPPPGSSRAFKDGYVDGCTSGFSDAGRDGYQTEGRKDVKRFAADAQYREGFKSGYAACFEEEKRHPKMLGAEGGSMLN